MASFTQKYHRHSYPSIDPGKPANSQAGRTVLVVGASEGIGFAIAQSFVCAGASRVILLGRRKSAIDEAVATLQQGLSAASETKVEGHACDLASGEDVAALWVGLAARKVHVDVLVLNASYMPFTDLGPKSSMPVVRKMFEVNVLASLSFVHDFMAQADGVDRPKAIVSISSFMAHAGPAPKQGPYSASKLAFATLLQHLADEVSASKVQIVSLHPGAILTPAAKRVSGMDENSLPWEDADVPGNFAVWASTPAARFLHGCFVWANWDVDEMMARSEEIEKSQLLKVSLRGLDYFDPLTFFQDISAKTV